MTDRLHSPQPWPERTVLAITLEHDYGKPERGPSCESNFFVRNLRSLVGSVNTVWYDRWLDDIPRIQREVLASAQAMQPDLIFVTLFRDELEAATLDQLREIAPTMVWLCDDSWRFEDHSKRYAPHFSHVVTTDIWRADDYRRIGIEPLVSQWAAQTLLDDAGPPSDADYRHEVAFVGLATPYRRWFVRHLRRSGIDVDCFGYGWRGGKLDFVEVERTFQRSRINLNISNSAQPDLRYVRSSPMCLAEYFVSKKRGEQIKARNFEIPAAGGFQLTNYPRGLERYFKVGEEVAVYCDPDQCVEQIQWYLRHEDDRSRVARSGFERAHRDHTYLRRLHVLLEHVWGTPSRPKQQLAASVGSSPG